MKSSLSLLVFLVFVAGMACGGDETADPSLSHGDDVGLADVGVDDTGEDNGGENLDESCLDSQEVCSEECVDISTNHDNCGECGQLCDEGEVCAAGSCETACPAQQDECDGGCFDLEESAQNCGACGNICENGGTCTNGECVVSCPSSQQVCADGCFNLETSSEHCGACGETCDDGLVCSDGECELYCPQGLEECESSCVNTSTSRSHCGGCGIECGAGEFCEDDQCVLACPPGQEECGGECVAVNFDPDHCGSCSNQCDSGAVCSGGSCETFCAGDVCDGDCTNTDYDPQNCGECGTTCGDAENGWGSCVQGECTLSCQSNWGNCNGQSTDGCETELSNSADHCGACGIQCAAGENCVDGGCVPNPPGGFTATAGDEAVVLSWNASTGATSYKVYRCATGVFCDADPIEETTALEWIDDDVSNGETYYYWVSADNGDYESGVNGPQNASPNTVATPVDLGCSIAGNHVYLTWSEGPSGLEATHYELLGSHDESTVTSQVAETSGDATHIYYGAGLDGEIYYAVRAVRDGELGIWESGISSVVGCTPSDPTELDAFATSEQATISWEASSWPSVTGDDNYAVHWRIAGSDDTPESQTITCDQSESCETTVLGLTNATTYTFWVTAQNAAGPSATPPDSGVYVEATPTGAGGGVDIIYGNEGVVVTSLSDGDDFIRSILELPEGKIMAIGAAERDEYMQLALVRYGDDGELDTTFGGLDDDDDGVALHDIGEGFDTLARGATLQDDGKIIVVGEVFTDATASDTFTARFNADGTLDTAFGDDGMVIISLSASVDAAWDAAVQDDGKIVVAADQFYRSGTSSSIFVVIRFLPDGQLDPLFGEAGIEKTSFGTRAQGAQQVRIQEDGKILVGGHARIGISTDSFALARYHPNGTLDESFGDGGLVTTRLAAGRDEAIYGMEIQPDGKIVAAGNANFNFGAARYNTDGSLDESFADEGEFVMDVSDGDNVARALSLQSDGKILIAGYGDEGSYENMIIIRLDEDGVLDPEFGNAGLLSESIGTTDDRAYSMILLENGKIILGGQNDNTVNWDFALRRFD